MNIGYVGLGAMGSGLARRLTRGEHQLTVWDLHGPACAPFEELGARVAPTAADLARDCEIVLLCLPRSSDVHALMFGAGGLAEGLSAGQLVVDQTSGVPEETAAIAAELAKRGVRMIDAPVSGGVVAAAAGTITIMASGPRDDFERALPILHAISPNVYACGEKVGDGQAMKLVNNMLAAGCRIAALEVVALGRKLGLSLKAVVDAMNAGQGSNRSTKITLQGHVDGKPAIAKFAMALMLKDITQAVQLGRSLDVPTPLASQARGQYQIGVNTMGADVQFDLAMDLIEGQAATRIAGEGGTAADVETLRVLHNALAACNQLMTLEAASIAVKYGLSLADSATLINRSSGWNAVSERLLPILSSGTARAGVAMKTMTDDLKQATRLAEDVGTPLLIANVAAALFEMGRHRFGDDADIDSMSQLFESMGGLSFTGA